MSDINEQNIKVIEDYVNKNQHILENTKYQNIIPFEFRPGDRTLLLSLPNIIQTYRDFKKSKKRPTKLFQNQKSEAELKTELLNKLMNYMKNKKHDIQLISENITEFTKSGENARCRVKCLLCEMSIVCTYTSFWAVSNYETHFKNHIKIIEEGRKAGTQGVTNNSESSSELRQILDFQSTNT